MVKILPAVQETWFRSLDWEDPLEEGMATHFSILAQQSPWTEEPGGLESMGLQRVGHDWVTLTSLHRQTGGSAQKRETHLWVLSPQGAGSVPTGQSPVGREKPVVALW